MTLDLDANRLSDSDRAVIRDRIASTVFHYSDHCDYVGKWSDVPTVSRVAYHAIGCTEYDLRESELSEIRAMVLEALKLSDPGTDRSVTVVVPTYGDALAQSIAGLKSSGRIPEQY